MRLIYYPYKIKFKHPFKLSNGVRSFTNLIFVELHHEGQIGYGEASLPPYLPETIHTVSDFLNRVDTLSLSTDNLKDTLVYIDKISVGNTAAKAALDIALHDLKGKLEKQSIRELYAIPNRDCYSTFTIGISTEKELVAKLKHAKAFKLIKMKLGSEDDKAWVSLYKTHCELPFCVDVNQGWKSKEGALELIHWLHDEGALFVEQPLPKNKRDEMAWLTEQSPIPIIADESIQRLGDLNKLNGVVDGINVKLMKSTGIAEAYQLLVSAKKMGFNTMIGCMAESSCAVTAAAHLAPLCDWADLDGPELIRNDPFSGMKLVKGKVIMPKKPGIGITQL